MGSEMGEDMGDDVEEALEEETSGDLGAGSEAAGEAAGGGGTTSDQLPPEPPLGPGPSQQGTNEGAEPGHAGGSRTDCRPLARGAWQR